MRKKLVDKNAWKHYVSHQADTSALHVIGTMLVLEHNWNRDINDFVTTTKVQVAVNTFHYS